MNAYINDIEAKKALISKNICSLNNSDKITILYLFLNINLK